MGNYCFGVDVGGTTVKCGLFRTDGTLLEKWEIPTRVEDGGKNIIGDIGAALLEKMEKKQLNREDLVGIGMGVPGPVDQNGVVPGAVNLHWGRKDLPAELGGLTGLPVWAGNDANVAALGEMWKGGGAGTKNLILATLGTGVGGGIIVNGHIVTGSHGAGGEIGHCRVNRQEEEACNCGNKGCLEQYASATGIARLARRKLESSGDASVLRDMDPEKITAKDVFDACKAGDSLAVQVIDQFAGYLGNALAVFATVVDPEVIVLGGGVSKAGDLLIEVVKKVFREDAFYVSKEIPIVLAKLGNDAGIYGAAKLAIDGNS